jgi:hypothetical protein
VEEKAVTERRQRRNNLIDVTLEAETSRTETMVPRFEGKIKEL